MDVFCNSYILYEYVPVNGRLPEHIFTGNYLNGRNAV